MEAVLCQAGAEQGEEQAGTVPLPGGGRAGAPRQQADTHRAGALQGQRIRG